MRALLLFLIVPIALSLPGCRRDDTDDDPQPAARSEDDGGGERRGPDGGPGSDDSSGKKPDDGVPSPPQDERKPLFLDGEVVCAPSGSLCANLRWLTPLNVGSESRVVITFVTAGRFAPTQPTAFLSVKPWMPEHGHGQGEEEPVIEAYTGGEGPAGAFLVSNIQFIMPGYWELQTRVNFEGQVQEFDIRVDVP